ncbi:MAG: 16S rRNA (guanine(966)-N(2))-methyltransferase RsmD [Limnohabitans sp.]|jgi:16S rRNA (guanine966-N2)-methyltransferase
MRPKSALPPARKPLAPARGQAAHQIRIIGGRWRRTPIKVLDMPGLRPTPDRVRETLFNWLGQDLTGWRCVDAFAGTGALGLEAASRGATRVLALELSPELARQLQQQAERLQASMLQVQRGDAVAGMQRLAADTFDLVFLDPPFDGPWFEPALRAAVRLVPVDGWVYLEAPVRWSDAALAPFGLEVVRHLQAGAVHAHLLRRTA